MPISQHWSDLRNLNKFKLPQVKDKGFVTRINSYSDEKQVSIKLDKCNDAYSRELAVAITCRGKIYYLDIIDASNEVDNHFLINKTKLSTGVHEFILYDTLGQSLIERKFFVPISKNSHNQPYTKELSINVNTKKSEYKPREK